MACGPGAGTADAIIPGRETSPGARMTIELGGFQGLFFLGLPLRLSGTVLLVLDLLFLLGLLLAGRRGRPGAARLARSWGGATLLILAGAAPVLSQVFLIRATGGGAAPGPGLPADIR